MRKLTGTDRQNFLQHVLRKVPLPIVLRCLAVILIMGGVWLLYVHLRPASTARWETALGAGDAAMHRVAQTTLLRDERLNAAKRAERQYFTALSEAKKFGAASRQVVDTQEKIADLYDVAYPVAYVESDYEPFHWFRFLTDPVGKYFERTTVYKIMPLRLEIITRREHLYGRLSPQVAMSCRKALGSLEIIGNYWSYSRRPDTVGLKDGLYQKMTEITIAAEGMNSPQLAAIYWKRAEVQLSPGGNAAQACKWAEEAMRIEKVVYNPCSATDRDRLRSALFALGRVHTNEDSRRSRRN